MTKAASIVFAALLFVAVLATAWLPASAEDPQIGRESVRSDGSQVHGPNMTAVVSGDGRFVAFASDAPDVIPSNGANRDIFLHDRATGATELISVATDGGEANGPSLFPELNADGRYIVFESQAGDLVSNDQQNYADIFVRDRQTGTTRRVDQTPQGGDTDDDSLTPSISADGRYVAYTSAATNIVPDDTNRARDVFLADLTSGTTERVSVATDGTQGNYDSGGFGAGGGHVTPDGRYVVFGSFANTLVPNDTNNADDIFVRDRVSHTTERVSVSTNGAEGNDHSGYPSISDDGRYVVFYSSADTLVPDDHNHATDVFLHDRQTGETRRLSGGTGAAESNGGSRFPDISGDGRFVAYQSDASNLVPNDTNGTTDIFRYDMQTGETRRISAPTDGGEAHGNTILPAINGDGSGVAFQAVAEDLIPADDNLT